MNQTKWEKVKSFFWKRFFIDYCLMGCLVLVGVFVGCLIAGGKVG